MQYHRLVCNDIEIYNAYLILCNLKKMRALSEHSRIFKINLPTHFGGVPIQTPLSEQCRVDPVPPSILCPFTQEYWTVDWDVLLTILKTGCSGSPHIVESEKQSMSK